MRTDTLAPMGRPKLELSVDYGRELARALRLRDRADRELWAIVDRGLAAGEPQAAIARTLGITRGAVAHRARARKTEAQERSGARITDGVANPDRPTGSDE
jgi:DNA invertase Pin-like site-specific DNA recombinase